MNALGLGDDEVAGLSAVLLLRPPGVSPWCLAMPSRFRTLPCRVLSLLFAVVLATNLSAQEAASNHRETAAKLLPASTIAFAELTDIDQLVGVVMDHPLRAKFEGLDEVKQAYASKPYLDFKAGVAIFESQLGKPWRPALKELTDGGAYAGFDSSTDGLAIFIKSDSKEALGKFLETVVRLAKVQANEQGNPNPIREVEYRGVKAYRFDENRVVQLDDWLLIANKGELGKKIIDAHQEGLEDSLADNPRFQQAIKARPQAAKLWAFLDVETIRSAGAAAEAFTGKAENPVVEMLIGGLLNTAQKTPYLTASMEAETSRIAVSLETPHQPEWASEEREFYFGPEGQGRAPLAVDVPNQLFTLSTYRDFSQMWLRAGDLFDEKTNDEFAKADGTLSTLFSGKDFGEDILGALHPEVQLLVTRQDFENVLPKPSIELPAFAIVGRLREPETMQRELKRTFQSLIGFLNVVGSMNGQPQLDLDLQKNGDALLVTSEYAPEEDQKESKKADIYYNFSPSIAFHQDVFVVSSTIGLAERIVERTTKSPANSKANTFAVADAKEILGALAANREHLIAQNMLDEGNTREEAEQQIGILLSVLEILDQAKLQLSPGKQTMKLDLEVLLKTEIKD